MIEYRKPWRRQPRIQHIKPADVSGLSSLVVLADLRDALSGALPTYVGTRPTITAIGRGRGFGSTVGAGTTDRVPTNAVARPAQTFVVVGVRNGPGGNNFGRYFQAGGTGVDPCEVFFDNSQNKTVFQRLSNNIAQFNWADPGVGVPFCTVISYVGDAAGWAPTVATNGVLQVVTTSVSPTGAAASVPGVISIGNRATDGARNWDGHWLLFAELPRALPAAECLSLSVNPWQLFQPRRIFIPQAGITGLPTLSAATYVPGSLTASGFRPRVTAATP